MSKTNQQDFMNEVKALAKRHGVNLALTTHAASTERIRAMKRSLGVNDIKLLCEHEEHFNESVTTRLKHIECAIEKTFRAHPAESPEQAEIRQDFIQRGLCSRMKSGMWKMLFCGAILAWIVDETVLIAAQGDNPVMLMVNCAIAAFLTLDAIYTVKRKGACLDT